MSNDTTISKQTMYSITVRYNASRYAISRSVLIICDGNQYSEWGTEYLLGSSNGSLESKGERNAKCTCPA